MKEIFAIIAAIIAVIGNVPYLVDAYKRRVKPHPYTWMVWVIVSTITLLGQIEKGAGVGALPAGVALVFTMTIFLFSLQYGFKYVRKTDKYFLAAALLGLIPWFLTKDPTWSVVIAVGIDLIAFYPTITKTWKKPHTETVPLYAANVVRHVLTLFSLQSYNVATTLHSISMICTNSIMTGIILFKKDPTNKLDSTSSGNHYKTK